MSSNNKSGCNDIILKENNFISSDPKKVSEIFNEHPSIVAIKENVTGEPFEFQPVSQESVLRLLTLKRPQALIKLILSF